MFEIWKSALSNTFFTFFGKLNLQATVLSLQLLATWFAAVQLIEMNSRAGAQCGSFYGVCPKSSLNLADELQTLFTRLSDEKEDVIIIMVV